MSHHARVRSFLEKAVEKATRPLAMSEWYAAIEDEAQLAGYSWDEQDLGPMGTNPPPAWKITVRVLLNGWHHKGEQVVRVGKGVYAPLHISPEDLGGEEELDEDVDAKGFIYAYCLPMAPGLIKIGETQDIEKRMAQHVILHKNAHLPDRPILLRVWKGLNHKAAEKAVHGVLGCRNKHYQGNGTGREWFKATIEDIEDILTFAAPGAFVKETEAVQTFEGDWQSQNG